MEKTKQIEISEQLYIRLDKVAKDQGFKNVHEYVNFILEELSQIEETPSKKLSNDEKEEIQEGLKKLGYK